MAKKKKTRVDLRKNRSKPPRPQGWTRGFHEHGFEDKATVGGERIRAKGELSRRRTIIQAGDAPAAADSAAAARAVDTSECLLGRVLRVHGLVSVLECDDGRQFRCVVRGILRTLSTDQRHVVAPGDRVWFRPAPNSEGQIERVEPRHGLLTRASRGRAQVIAANVDQLVIVASLVEPDLKPHLIDRYLATSEQRGIAPVICLNKADLVDATPIQPLIGLYSQLGVPTFLTSAVSGQGVSMLREQLRGRQSVVSGQSGVGKSSLLNAVQPGLGLAVAEVSEGNQKGRHTTTTAQLLKLDVGGWVFDTPGLRQFQLWDVIPGEVEGLFVEFRPFVHLCAFPDCTHTHEARCAIKRAVRLGLIAAQRYMSYLGLFGGEAMD